MHAEVDGGDTIGVTDLEHVPAPLMDGVGVGVLENSCSCLCSCHCFALSARTHFLIGGCKALAKGRNWR